MPVAWEAPYITMTCLRPRSFGQQIPAWPRHIPKFEETHAETAFDRECARRSDSASRYKISSMLLHMRRAPTAFQEYCDNLARRAEPPATGRAGLVICRASS